MDFWNEEDYFEPSEFNEKIEELKDALRNSVKQEIKDEVERLRKENENLRSVKNNWESIKRDFEKKKNEYERKMQDAEFKAKRARISELMDPYKIIMWSASWSFRYKEKCDKCNSDRQIQITLPSGKIVNDECKCCIREKVYYPKENVLYELTGRDGKIGAWYSARGEKDNEYFALNTFARTVVNHNKTFDTISEDELKETFFASKEECEEFCNYLNEKRDVSGYIYNLRGQLISEAKEREKK